MTEVAASLIALSKQNEAILKGQKVITEQIKVLFEQQKILSDRMQNITSNSCYCNQDSKNESRKNKNEIMSDDMDVDGINDRKERDEPKEDYQNNDNPTSTSLLPHSSCFVTSRPQQQDANNFSTAYRNHVKLLLSKLCSKPRTISNRNGQNHSLESFSNENISNHSNNLQQHHSCNITNNNNDKVTPLSSSFSLQNLNQRYNNDNSAHGSSVLDKAAESKNSALIHDQKKNEKKRKIWSLEENQLVAKKVQKICLDSWELIKNKHEELSARSYCSLKMKWHELCRTKQTEDLRVCIPESLETLPDNVFFSVLQFIYSPSLCGVAKLCREVGVISKSIQRKCHNFMQEIPLDINMAEIDTTSRRKYIFPALEWIRSCAAKLNSFSIYCSMDDFGIIAGFLRDCNASEMQKLSIYHNDCSILSEYYWHCIRTGADIIDVDDSFSFTGPISYIHMAFGCGVHRDLICNQSILFTTIVQNAPKIKTLCFHIYDNSMLPHDFIRKLNHLEEFEYGWHDLHDLVPEQGRIAVDLVKRIQMLIPRIRKLKLVTSIPYGSSSSTALYYEIASDTLEEIDVVGTHKSFWFKKVTCPSLRVFRNGPMNGIRPRLPLPHHNVYLSGTKLAGDFPCEGVSVPSSCVLEFDHY